MACSLQAMRSAIEMPSASASDAVSPSVGTRQSPVVECWIRVPMGVVLAGHAANLGHTTPGERRAPENTVTRSGSDRTARRQQPGAIPKLIARSWVADKKSWVATHDRTRESFLRTAQEPRTRWTPVKCGHFLRTARAAPQRPGRNRSAWAAIVPAPMIVTEAISA
jgi:hypothetical protein